MAQWEWAWGAWGGGGADGGGKRGDQLEKRGRRSWVACSEVGRPGLGYLVPFQGGRGQAAHGALHVLCSAPGLLLPVGEGPVHSWLQHVPRHPHDCHGHPVSFPVRFPTAFKGLLPTPAQSPCSAPPTPDSCCGCQPWRSLGRRFPHPYDKR